MTRTERYEFWFIAIGITVLIGYLGACVALLTF